jgi:hypothetical protein
MEPGHVTYDVKQDYVGITNVEGPANDILSYIKTLAKIRLLVEQFQGESPDKTEALYRIDYKIRRLLTNLTPSYPKY